MFGKVQEEGFQSIFDLSLDNVILNGGNGDSTFDSHNDRKNKGIIGVRTTTNHQSVIETSNRDSLSPSLYASLLLSPTASTPLHLQQTPNNDPWSTKNLIASKVEDSDIEQLQKLRSSGFASNNFSQNQLEQIQKIHQLSLNERQQLSNLCLDSNDIPSPSDLVYRQQQQQQQQKINHHSNSNQNSFLFDHHNHSTSCSSDSSSASSSSEDSTTGAISSPSDSSSLTGANSKVNTSRYKTEMCRPFQENGSCKYGDKCQFAHGFGELRTVTRHPKYKTDLCRTYHASGFCPYGPRCHFVHNLEEASSQQIPANVVLRPGHSSSPHSSNGSSSSPMPINSNTTDADKADIGGVRPLPMFSPQRNIAPPKLFNGRNGGNTAAFNFELKLNSNTNKLPSYLNVSSGEGSVASLSPVTPVSSDDICSTSFSRDNARSPTRLPVFSTLFH